jgi:hypothetical protein
MVRAVEFSVARTLTGRSVPVVCVRHGGPANTRSPVHPRSESSLTSNDGEASAERFCGPDVFFDTPRALCGSAEPTVIDNQLPGVYPQHASGTNSEQPTPRTRLDRVVVSVGDRAVHYGNGQSGLIAFACTGTLNPLGQSGRRGSRT